MIYISETSKRCADFIASLTAREHEMRLLVFVSKFRQCRFQAVFRREKELFPRIKNSDRRFIEEDADFRGLFFFFSTPSSVILHFTSLLPLPPLLPLSFSLTPHHKTTLLPSVSALPRTHAHLNPNPFSSLRFSLTEQPPSLLPQWQPLTHHYSINTTKNCLLHPLNKS